MSTEPDWKARAESAEARVKELEARLTVTDEMVERAEAELDALFSGSPNCTLSDIARAALTAALETRHD